MTRRLAACVALLAPSLARAEGTAEFGSTQSLDPSTLLRVDILDYTTETITWQGDHPIELADPSNVTYATLNPGDTVSVTSDGTWLVHLSDYEDDWDLSVSGATPGMGRVWSRSWYVDAGEFSESHALNGSFYALVGGGGDGYDGVVELQADGLAGYVYVLTANNDGVDGANGRSVPETDHNVYPDYPVYLNPPEIANYNTLTPEVSGDTWSAGATGCDEVAYGLVDGEFTFTSTVDGTYHVVCDLNGDGQYDITSDDDLQLLGDAVAGENTVTWDGADNAGNPVDPGTYSCRILLTVGEFHYVAGDVETCYEGFRLFSLDSTLSRHGLDMFWNDTEVAGDEDEAMPNGEWSLDSSGSSGVNAGTYGSAFDPNGNARSWGSFNVTSKGNEDYLDTYTWIDEDWSDTFEIVVADWTLDTDADGLHDAEEDCTYGTDPDDPDTDDDGLGDYDEAVVLPSDPLVADSDSDGLGDADECSTGSCPDSDADGLPDVVDADDDDDGVLTADEDADGDGDPRNDDTDGDGTPDYLDLDDDGDGIPTSVEDTGDPGDLAHDDADGDGVPNHRDADDDGDGVPTALEDVDTDGDATNDDTDGDGTANWLDTDDDDDGLLTVDEDSDGDGTALGDDDDGDGVDNHLDPDSDDDGIGDGTEGAEDTDGDGAPDFVDLDADGDSLLDADEGVTDSDGDGAEDFQDPDDDGDSVPTIDETGQDTDGDTIDDHLDPDDDGDTVPTIDEAGMDTDGDRAPDYLDTDDDDDGILTAHENDEAWEDDVDGDGTPNWRDTDSDADDLLDADEGEVDTDGDVVPDYLDPDGEYVTWYKGGCDGCSSGGGAPGGSWLALAAGVALIVRRRDA